MSIITSKYVTIKNFIPSDMNESLTAYAMKNANKFVQHLNYSKGQIQYCLTAASDFDSWKWFIREQIKFSLYKVFEAFNSTFDLDQITADVRCYPDAGYASPHQNDCKTRKLSYFYFFNTSEFSGGQVALYDTEVDSFRNEKRANSCQFIKPENNTLFVFPSRCWLEVLTVSCNTRLCPKNFLDGGSFAVHGHIYEKIKDAQKEIEDLQPSLRID